LNSVRIELSTAARREYERLFRSNRQLFDRVQQALERLLQDPFAGKTLHGPLAGRRSLRVGSLRVIYTYEAERLLVLVLLIRQRDKAYR
jgi:addiction module RelE/StbE family toxin